MTSRFKSSSLKVFFTALLFLAVANASGIVTSIPLKNKKKPVPSEPIKPLGPQEPDPDAPIKPMDPKKPGDPNGPIKPL